MTKKLSLFATLLAVLTSFSFIACNDTEEPDPEPQTVTKTIVWEGEDLQKISLSNSDAYYCQGIKLYVLRGTATGKPDGTVDFVGAETNGPSFAFTTESPDGIIRRIEISADSFVANVDESTTTSWKQVGDSYVAEPDYNLIGFYSAYKVKKITIEFEETEYK